MALGFALIMVASLACGFHVFDRRRAIEEMATASQDESFPGVVLAGKIKPAMSAGVMGMDKFHEDVRKGTSEVAQITGQLGEIIHQITLPTPRCESVNQGMQTPAAGSQQTAEALGHWGETALQTAKTLRRSNQAVDPFSTASRGLKDSISRFKVAT